MSNLPADSLTNCEHAHNLSEGGSLSPDFYHQLSNQPEKVIKKSSHFKFISNTVQIQKAKKSDSYAHFLLLDIVLMKILYTHAHTHTHIRRKSGNKLGTTTRAADPTVRAS